MRWLSTHHLLTIPSCSLALAYALPLLPSSPDQRMISKIVQHPRAGRIGEGGGRREGDNIREVACKEAGDLTLVGFCVAAMKAVYLTPLASSCLTKSG